MLLTGVGIGIILTTVLVSGGIATETAGGGGSGGSLVVTTFSGRVAVLYFGDNWFLTIFRGRILRVGVGAAWIGVVGKFTCSVWIVVGTAWVWTTFVVVIAAGTTLPGGKPTILPTFTGWTLHVTPGMTLPVWWLITFWNDFISSQNKII